MVMEFWLLWEEATGVWDRSDNMVQYLQIYLATVFGKTGAGRGEIRGCFLTLPITLSLLLPSIQASRKIFDISLSSSPIHSPAQSNLPSVLTP